MFFSTYSCIDTQQLSSPLIIFKPIACLHKSPLYGRWQIYSLYRFHIPALCCIRKLKVYNLHETP